MEVSKSEKEFVYDKLLKLLAKNCYIFKRKASECIDLDTSWTQKALIEGMKVYAALQKPLYREESKSEGHEKEIVFLIKPFINDFYRWVIFKLGQDENGEDIVVFIISAHKDEKIYGSRN